MSKNICGLEFTHHALQRWNQRCAGLTIEKEWENAQLPTNRVLRIIRKSCKKNAAKVKRKSFYYKYFLSLSGVVFVYDTTGVVITIFRLSGGKVVNCGNRNNFIPFN